MPSEAAVIMAIAIPEVSAFSAAKIRDGVKELRAIQQFGCQTALNVASVINNYNLSATLSTNGVGLRYSCTKAKAASGRADGFGYTRSLDSCEGSRAPCKRMCGGAHVASGGLLERLAKEASYTLTAYNFGKFLRISLNSFLNLV